MCVHFSMSPSLTLSCDDDDDDEKKTWGRTVKFIVIVYLLLFFKEHLCYSFNNSRIPVNAPEIVSVIFASSCWGGLFAIAMRLLT